MIKIIAIIIFLVIIASLGQALFHLVKRPTHESSEKIAKALTIRIGISIVLFILLFIAFATGLFQPHGIGASIQQNRAEKSLSPP